MSIAIYTLTSELHNEKAVDAQTREFLNGLGMLYELKGQDYADFGDAALNLIFVRTGGTEGLFQKLLPMIQPRCHHPFYLLTSGKSNSLAASMEILSYLRQNGIKGEIIHGSTEYVAQRIALLAKAAKARKRLEGCRLGVIGEPSDWLISSHADKKVVLQRLGIELKSIDMQELLATIEETPENSSTETAEAENVRNALPGAERIYGALKTLALKHRLNGFTLRCFDLLTTVKNTGCLALARLNSEGLVASCEGDVPAMLSMMVGQVLTGSTGFQANPATINPETGELLFAHCTIPLNMVERYELDTHFESGIGVGIRGYMKEGPVTIFKLAGDLSRCFIAEGELVRNQADPGLCRTQQMIRLKDKQQAGYFLNEPIGNHHIIMQGHHAEVLSEFFKLTRS